MLDKNPKPAPPKNDQLDETVFTGTSDIDMVAQAVSPQVALLLLEHFAGVELRGVKKMHRKHFIAQKIGYENALMLSEYLGTGIIIVPVKHPVIGLKRNRQIAAMIKRGITRREIAVHFNISQRHIRRLAANMGLSGRYSITNAKVRHLTAPKRKSNGGLTGGCCEFATQPPSTLPKPPYGAVCSIHGYYLPQQKKENK